MSNPSIDIPNLLYRYANFIDAGDFASAAKLFDKGCVEAEGYEIKGRENISQLWKDWIFLYDDVPQTRHLITNPIISISDDLTNASCQSQWTVLQATESLPLQPIATGRYDDNFAYADGAWYFTRRKYDGIDLMGDMSQHTRKALKETEE
ncbi:nuclear transport factor 2 family protein [Hellea sp.]|nr:nuclear transport factor 2 family protein [Hellea sp.]